MKGKCDLRLPGIFGKDGPQWGELKHPPGGGGPSCTRTVAPVASPSPSPRAPSVTDEKIRSHRGKPALQGLCLPEPPPRQDPVKALLYFPVLYG